MPATHEQAARPPAHGPFNPFGPEQVRDRPGVRVLPFDHVARFELTGSVGNLVQDVIDISVEGVFVAVSVGYGLEVEPPGEGLVPLERPADPVPDPNPTLDQPPELAVPRLGDVPLDALPADVLIEGFRIHPDLQPTVLERVERRRQGRLPPGEEPLDIPLGLVASPFQRVPTAPDGFSFLLNVVDTGSGRELQNRPVHSVATLGSADGRRPFKMLPQPMVFMPRSTVRLQIEERTPGVRGELFVTLQGYKVLGQAGEVEDEVRRLGRFDPPSLAPVYDHATGRYLRSGDAGRPDLPDRRVVPFDYVAVLELEGRPDRKVSAEVPVHVDGGYLATAIGYSLAVGPEEARLTIEPPAPDGTARDSVDLRGIRLRDVRPVEALFDGLAIHPRWLRLALGCDGRLSRELPRELLPTVDGDAARIDAGPAFRRLNRPESLRFLYSITDTGTGRELQDRPVHSVAGLGIADGRRPFRVLHRPMAFLPRSTIRVEVEERRGRGNLYLVFQGYKLVPPPSGAPGEVR